MEVASQHPHAQDAPAGEVQTPATAGTVGGPGERMPTRVAQPWGQESLEYAQSKGDAQRPSAEADRATALDLDLWLPRTSDVERLTIQVRTRWVLMDIHHIINGTRTMADVVLNHREGQHSPPPTMEHPRQWLYVATHLTAHIGAYTPDSLDWLHWRWHQRAALRIRESLIGHNIWTIRTPRPRGPPTQDRATGHQRQRSPTTQRPPRQVARTSHSQRPHRRPPDVAPPCSPQQSPLRLFTNPRPDHGHQRAPDRETGQHSPRTPQPPQGSRRLAGTRRKSPTPPSAARRVTFRADTDNSQDEPGGRLRRL